MVESRIINYDGENVTFYYSDHTNEEYHEETDSAFEFITKLLRNLLPPNFKSIRSYVFYNKSSKLCDNIVYVIAREKIRIKRELLKWKNLIITSFNRIHIIFPLCGELMKPTFEVSWRRVTMSNMLRKIKRQSVPVFSMSLKVEWPKCKNFKLIPRETFQKNDRRRISKRRNISL